MGSRRRVVELVRAAWRPLGALLLALAAVLLLALGAMVLAVSLDHLAVYNTTRHLLAAFAMIAAAPALLQAALGRALNPPPSARKAPAALLALCPGCGRGAEGPRCSRCSLSLVDRERRWSAPRPFERATLLGLAIALCLALLALFSAGGALFIPWMADVRLGCAGLAMMLGLVAAVILLCVGQQALDHWKTATFRFAYDAAEGDAHRWVEAQARVVFGKVRDVSGCSVWTQAPPPHEAQARPDLSRAERDLLRLLVSLKRARLASWWMERRLVWRGPARESAAAPAGGYRDAASHDDEIDTPQTLQLHLHHEEKAGPLGREPLAPESLLLRRLGGREPTVEGLLASVRRDPKAAASVIATADTRRTKSAWLEAEEAAVAAAAAPAAGAP